MLHVENISVVFGHAPQKALKLLDQGLDRESIYDATNQVVGVANATIEVHEGEIFVLMGLSGSGKSTLLRCINALYKPTRGRVLIDTKNDSIDLNGCSERELREIRRKRIAMVFQRFALLPWRTVRQNVAFGLEINGLSKTSIAEMVDDKLRLVELDMWADSPISELSGGMQQRVGLARALATDADILLLDEPFSALDPIIRSGLQDELLALQSRLNKTIVFVTHDLDEALKLGNRVAIMDRGRIVQQGTPEDIVLKPANDYVKQFVSNVNPLNVFKAVNIMKPLNELTRSGDRIVVIEGRIEVIVNAKDEIIEIESQGMRIPISSGRATSPGKGVEPAIHAPETPLRELLKSLKESSSVVLVCEGARLLGVIRGFDVLSALDTMN